MADVSALTASGGLAPNSQTCLPVTSGSHRWIFGTTIDPKELVKLSQLSSIRDLYLPGSSWTPGAGSKIDENASLKYLASLKTLEKLEFSLHFLPYFNVTDTGFEQLAPLTQLKELRCAQCRITKQGLAPFVNLQSLDLSYAAFGDAGMPSLEGMHDLRRLYLRDTLVTDEGLKHIAGLTRLEELDLYGTHVTDAGIAYLKDMKDMRKFILLGAPITDASAKIFAGMPKLRELNLYRSHITNAGLSEMSKLKEMATLDLRYSRVSATGVEAFRAAVPGCEIEFAGIESSTGAKPPSRPSGTSEKSIGDWITSLGGKAEFQSGHIRAVSLASTHVNDAQLGYLATLGPLASLDLQATEIGDAGLQQIARMKSLKELNLSNTTVADTGVAYLAQLPQLRSLRLRNTLVKGTGIAFPQLETLDLGGSPVNNAGLAKIAKLPGLKELSLADSEVTDAGLDSLAGLTGLTLLNLNGADIGDAGLEKLSALTELRELDLNYTRFTEKGLAALKDLSKLERLTLVRTRTSDTGMSVIASLQNLQSLNIDYTSVNNKNFATIKGLAHLQNLSLDSAAVGDDAVDTIVSLRELRKLNLYHTQVTQADVDRIKAALPECSISWDKTPLFPIGGEHDAESKAVFGRGLSDFGYLSGCGQSARLG